MMKYSKIAAIIAAGAAACLMLAACHSDADSQPEDAGSYRILYMPSYPSADNNEGGTGTGTESGNGNGNTAGQPDASSRKEVDDGRQQVVSAQTVSSAGEIKSQREALDLVKNRVLPIRFKNLPAMEYKDGENGATGKYTGTMQRPPEYGAEGSMQVYVAVEGEGPEFFRVVYYSETPNSSGSGRNIIEYLASYQVYRDGRVKDVFQGEFIGIKE